MFNDRDLGILGAGALLAVLCLFLPFSFAGKVVVGFLVLVGVHGAGLVAPRPDRVPPEVWLDAPLSLFDADPAVCQPADATRRTESAQHLKHKNLNTQPFEREHPAPSFNAYTAQTIMRPVDLAWNEVGVYPLLTALLGVVGVYFAVWLAQRRRGGTFDLVQVGE